VRDVGRISKSPACNVADDLVAAKLIERRQLCQRLCLPTPKTADKLIVKDPFARESLVLNPVTKFLAECQWGPARLRGSGDCTDSRSSPLSFAVLSIALPSNYLPLGGHFR
jgi:hypothetical protein